MAKIHLGSLSDAVNIASKMHATRAIAMLDPGVAAPNLRMYGVRQHLKTDFPASDLADDRPTIAEVEKVMAVVCAPQQGDLLIYSTNGLRRAPAVAYVAIALAARRGREVDALMYVRLHAPYAEPDRRIVELADKIVGRSGALIKALDDLAPSRRPVYAGPSSVAIAI